jgi:hypothetical protein
MDDPKVPPLKTRILTRSSEPCHIRGQRLAEAYQTVCPEIRLSLPDKPSPMPPLAGRGPLAAIAAAGAQHAV